MMIMRMMRGVLRKRSTTRAGILELVPLVPPVGRFCPPNSLSMS